MLDYKITHFTPVNVVFTVLLHKYHNVCISVLDKSFVAGVMFGSCGPPVKRPRDGPVGPRTVVNHLNGKTRIGGSVTRIGRKQVISWMDAPDDVYFRSTDGTKWVFCFVLSQIYGTGKVLYMINLLFHPNNNLKSINLPANI